MQKQTFTLTAENTVGVLRRVAGIFSRKGYNIETIHAEPLNEQMTVIRITAFLTQEQSAELVKMLRKLYDVADVEIG